MSQNSRFNCSLEWPNYTDLALAIAGISVLATEVSPQIPEMLGRFLYDKFLLY